MNLALHDVRRHSGRFLGTAAGLGLLFAVVLAMAGIYAGLVEDAVGLARATGADLWVVQRGSNGPFAGTSRLDPSLEARVAAVPGVARARAFTHATIQGNVGGRTVRFGLVGLAWPSDRGEGLPIVTGRPLGAARGEIVADRSLGLVVGQVISLAGEEHRVVGVTRGVVTSGGDPVLFMSVADSRLVADEMPPETVTLERRRTIEELRATDLGRSQPALEDLATDPRWRGPGLPSPSVAAILVDVDAPHRLQDVRRTIAAWPDVDVHTAAEQEALLLDGVVKKARVQLGLFSIILTITSTILVTMVVYNLTREKTHDIAVLALLGAPVRRVALLVLQEAWILGALGYLVARAAGSVAFPLFARRIVLTPAIEQAAPALVLVVVTLASLLAVAHALRVDPARVLET
jgi:putative ABC transport system permease protein